MPDFGKPQQWKDSWGYLINGRWVDERTIPHDVRPWRPFVQTIPYRPDGVPDYDVSVGVETFYANSHYLVFKRLIPATNEDSPSEYMVHLSMRTVENDVRHDWREMQRVKNELAGPEWEAVEIYPAESRVVDTANQYHLWCFPFSLGFGFGTGLIKTPEEVKGYGGAQRPFRED